MVGESSCVSAGVEFQNLHEVGVGLGALVDEGDEKLHTQGGGCSFENP